MGSRSSASWPKTWKSKSRSSSARRGGSLQPVRYDAVNAMLLNEFLKEHRKNEQREATVTQLLKQTLRDNSAAVARIDEQAAQIKKVSAQIEMNKFPPQTVVNNR